MKLFDKSYYRMTKLFMSFLGQWPLQSPCNRRIIRTLVTFFMLSIAIPEVISLVSVLDDLDTVFECIPPLGLHVLNALKYLTCTCHMDKLLKLMTHMERDWKSRVDGDGSDVLNQCAKRGRILAVAYAYYMLLGGVLYVCAPLLPLVLDIIQPLNVSRPREFLFRTEYFVDQDTYFVPIFFHAVLTTFISMVIVVGCDTMYGAYVHYACAIFIELGDKLENPVTNEAVRLNVSKDNDYIYQHMVECVKKHQEAIEFCKLIESTYTTYFLCAIGINVFLISFTGVQTVMKMEDPNLVIRYSCFTFGVVVHAFFNCWHGQLLIDHSEKITTAVYKSKWYKFSIRSQRLLTLMMIRSAKPCQITAGKLFSVSLEIFTTIMKMAISYFTVLRSLQ